MAHQAHLIHATHPSFSQFPMFSTPAAKWHAVLTRNPEADNFVYAVTTTKIYCRPFCPSRLARRANIEFYDTSAEADLQGYRPCKRCKPELKEFIDPHVDIVRQACHAIDAATDSKPTLTELASQAGMTPSHFHRVFKKIMGVTTGQYYKGLTSAVVNPTAVPSPHRQVRASSQPPRLRPRMVDHQEAQQQLQQPYMPEHAQVSPLNLDWNMLADSAAEISSPPLPGTDNSSSPSLSPSVEPDSANFAHLSPADIILLNAIGDTAQDKVLPLPSLDMPNEAYS
ncbi:metal binding domain of Ada-domain-containing protein, partial [Lipomyces japonicus]|uniref:metal binding domain of Ada-domain-containing protein n=1 Tax=Lipomyces japonicus TaxID=56871 RepID=UPI0034CD9546